MHRTRRLMMILAGIALLPLVSVLATAAIAGITGCEVNEGGPTPCFVLGIDIGGLLASSMVMGWLSLLTIPFFMGLVLLWLIMEAFVWARQRRKARRAERMHEA